ncbi:MAG: hypothetical protein LUD69_02825 [Oscillospiraceae bacterium]|nr:hypothetical protein [Oscillospiraceae bacterium]
MKKKGCPMPIFASLGRRAGSLWKKRWLRRLLLAVLAVILFCAAFLAAQTLWAHRDGYFVPDYPQVTLTEQTDLETIFLQTGLGASAVEKLLEAGDFQTILDAQETFFNPPQAECRGLLGWFTREDRIAEGSGVPLVDLQPGDIVLTLSTHTAGWRHGHAGLVIDGDTALECVVLGTDSTLKNVSHWSTYSNYAVLRVKDVTAEEQQQVVEYSLENLLDIPYRLTAGLLGSAKAPDPSSRGFGLQCSYLVWYAWYQLGYDLDSDGGRLATTYDLLHSDLLEVVQVYGMDPRDFLEE